MRISDWSSDVCSSDLQIVGENHREGFVVDEVAGAPHRMPESERLHLPGERGLARRRHPGADRIEGRRLAPFGQRLVELVGDVEMILDGILAPEIGRASCRARVW